MTISRLAISGCGKLFFPRAPAAASHRTRGVSSRCFNMALPHVLASTTSAPSSQQGGTVLLVESPTKAKKIQQYLGDEFKVIASYGHVRDLSSKEGSVKPEEDFEMVWSSSLRGRQQIKETKDALKHAQKLLLATDPDREGEAIAWHMLELLGGKLTSSMEVHRVAFTEVTKKAVLAAIDNPRQISQELVDAYLARRALDYLVGFSISPVLWRKLPGARSAGRVQSVALRLLCEREAEVEAFKPEQYWTIDALLATEDGSVFSAHLTEVDGERVGPRGFPDKQEAIRVMERLKAASLEVSGVTLKDQRRNPSAPFTTSTMQQEAARRLGMTTSATMRNAQALYEGEGVSGEGLITYMRTDGVSMSEEATNEIRELIQGMFGPEHVSAKPKVYKSKAKNAQEAHEAIRPVSAALKPEELPAHLDDGQRRLYELIWCRAMASQGSSAVYEQIGADIAGEGGRLMLRATGRVLKFPGYLAVYGQEAEDTASDSDSDNEAGGQPENAVVLRKLQAGHSVTCIGEDDDVLTEHWTKPPPRYNEASLVSTMEGLGIGRPSTYAPTIKLLKDRKYMYREGRTLVPNSLGRVLSEFLKAYFNKYVDYSFTASLEGDLDNVASGEAAWKDLLHEFWGSFHSNVSSVKDISVREVIDFLDEQLGPHLFPETEGSGEGGSAKDPRQCPACETGRLGLKLGRQGGFIGCSNFSKDEPGGCKYVRQLGAAGEDEQLNGYGAQGHINAEGYLELGTHPETGLPITLRAGPYGPYLQMEDAAESAGKRRKFKRASVPKGMNPSDMTVEIAVDLLKLPMEIGKHPEDGEPVMVCNGPFGFYAEHGGVRASLRKDMDPLSLTVSTEVLELLDRKRQRLAAKANASKGASSKAAPAKARSKKEEKPQKKKAPSAYQVFCQERREALKAEKPDLSFGDTSKELAAMWRSLGEDEKEQFQQKAAASTDSSKGAKKSAARASRPRAPTKSKRPASAYLCFCQENREALVAKKPELKFGEIAKELGAMWRSLPDEEKEAFKLKVEASESDDDSSGAEEAPKPSNSRGSVQKKPKRRPSAYNVFCQEHRQALVTEKPDLTFGEIAKELSAMWKSLGDDGKAEFKLKVEAQSRV